MKPFRKLLVPTDFSEHAVEALETAIDLARRYSAPIVLIHVFDRVVYPFPDSTAITTTLQVAKAEDDVRGALDEQAKLAAERGAERVETKLLRGDPAGEIVDFAKREGVDLIVMGTHGRRGVSRFLIGSVAERVVRTAPCAVLCVRLQPAPDQAGEAG